MTRAYEMTFVPEETIVGKLNRLSMWVLFRSYVYYNWGDNIVTDYHFDCIAQQLHEMMLEHPEEFKLCRNYEGIKGFEGSTGMGLFEACPEWLQKRIMKDYAWYVDEHRNGKYPDGRSCRNKFM